MQGILELFIVYTIAYSLLLPVQAYALSVQRHSLPLLLTLCLVTEYCGVLLSLIHYAKFSVDGDGLNAVRVVGSFTDTLAQVLDSNNQIPPHTQNTCIYVCTNTSGITIHQVHGC